MGEVNRGRVTVSPGHAGQARIAAPAGHDLPAVLAQVTPPAFSSYASLEGGALVSDSYTVDLNIPAGLALPLSFACDYDYTLDVQVSQMPPPRHRKPRSAWGWQGLR